LSEESGTLRSPEELRQKLREIDGRGYPAYKSLAGGCDFGEFLVQIDHVQGDPFASPSRLRLTVPHPVCQFPRHMLGDRTRRIALADFVARRVAEVIRESVKGRRGTGGSGNVLIDVGGQQVLERSAVVVTDSSVEARLDVGLPGYGRRIAAKEAEEILFVELPRVVRQAMLFDPMTSDQLSEHITSVVSQRALREQLADHGLVAFIADGSILPRAGGTSPVPMDVDHAVLFESCEECRVTLSLPSGAGVPGMGIPQGVTLIVGGGYHGKSTLLDAIRTGIYDHIPGDGRECVATRPDAMMIRAEDRRRVEGVDISPFIRDLPSGASTADFRTESASGSTSQAANIMEALETGVTLLLLDEDTSATNFMVRDARMQRLVPGAAEPIIPLVDCVRALWEQHGISSVIVMGGCGDYLEVADTVIMMEAYRPVDVTSRAKEVVRQLASQREAVTGGLTLPPVRRVPDPASVDSSRGRRASRIATRGMDSVVFGAHEISFRAIEMLVDESQLRAIGEGIEYARRAGYIDGTRSVAEVAKMVEDDIAERGVECVSPHYGRHPGALASFRRHDFVSALNRLPTLLVRQERGEAPAETPAEAPTTRPRGRRGGRSSRRRR